MKYRDKIKLWRPQIEIEASPKVVASNNLLHRIWYVKEYGEMYCIVRAWDIFFNQRAANKPITRRHYTNMLGLLEKATLKMK